MRSNKTLKYFRNFIKKTPNLTGKERFVLVKRLKSKTLSSIGTKFGVTEGRVRQIERIAINKIKSKFKQLNLFNTY